MNIARHQVPELKLYPVRYDLDILERVLRPGPTWAYKEAEMAALEEVTLNNINDPEKADEVETLKYFLGQVEAAKMVCRAKGTLVAFERSENPSAIVKDILADHAAERPICFCDHFWVVEKANGERFALARGVMQEIEMSLSHGTQNSDPEYQMAEVFSFLMKYSHFAGQDLQMKSIADEGLSRLIHDNLVPQFLRLPLLPCPERDGALKELRSMLISAFDAASRENDFNLHGSRVAVEWRVTGGESKRVLPAWAAIQHVKTWLAQNLELPKKGWLQKHMIDAHPELLALKKSSWSDIWADAGLKGLPDLEPWSGSPKLPDFDEPHFRNMERQAKK